MIIKGNEAKQKLLEGINETVDVVKSTLGAKGRTVMIADPYRMGFNVTKDGVSVAKAVKFDDDILNLGSDFVKNAAMKTLDEAGDGTTTSSVLVQSMCNDIFKEISLGKTTGEVTKELFENAEEVYDFISKNSRKVESVKDIENIATVSSNNDKEIGKLFSDIYSEAGMSVSIEVVENDDVDTTFEIVNGFTISNTGFSASQFINNYDKNRIEYENPKVYIYNGKIKMMSEHLMEIFKDNVDRNSEYFRPTILIVEDIEEMVLREFISAYGDQAIFNIAIVQSNLIHQDRKDALIDSSVFLNGDYTEDRLGKYGECEKIIITKDNTTFINGKGNTKKHLDKLKKENSKKNNIALKNRIFSLESNAAIIKVGGKLGTEISEKKDRIDDANLAVKSAIEEGYLPGGGSTYLFAEKDHFGKVMKNALHSCYNQLMNNAEVEPNLYLKDIYTKGFGFGYNLIKDDITDMYEDGIYDSSKVLRVSIENAVHTAVNFAGINSILI